MRRKSSSDIADVTVAEDLHSYPVSQVPHSRAFAWKAKLALQLERPALVVSKNTTLTVSRDGETWLLLTDELAEFKKYPTG